MYRNVATEMPRDRNGQTESARAESRVPGLGYIIPLPGSLIKEKKKLMKKEMIT